MKKSNSKDKKCPHGHLIQGVLCDHGPAWDWEDLGEKYYEPNPGLFGKKTYWMSRHCGRPMARYKVIQKQKCLKCGTIRDNVDNCIALCLCCGHHFSQFSNFDVDM